MTTASGPDRRRILSLWLPRLPTDRRARDRRRSSPFAASPEPQAAAAPPRATVAKVGAAQILAAVDGHAEACGLEPGLGLAEARALVPELAVDPHDPEADAALLAGLATACDRYTPLVALDPPDGLFLDVTGCAHLFGGEAGLAGYLASEAVDLLVDATHPFAARISVAAERAAAAAGRPRLRLERPGWTAEEGDRWIHVADLAEAAAALAPGACAFVTVGRQELCPFLRRPDVTIVARTIEPPAHPLPERIRLVRDRPPYGLEHERAALARYRADVLVTKNSGGAAMAAKLEAARDRAIPVVMVDRPGGQPAADAADVDGCLALIRRHLAAP
jgi:precorrin-6A/cobalt-precorrin-6A reductase